MLRFLTAGESHGKALVAVLEGIPSGLSLSARDIDGDLARRQKGYGRGGRMQIERDTAEIMSGVRHGVTLGSPISLVVRNRDWENWESTMAVERAETAPDNLVTCPRPGHADLVGVMKYGHDDIRNVLERASARETAARVACGAVAKRLLAELGVKIVSHVVSIGTIRARGFLEGELREIDAIAEAAESSPVRCAHAEASQEMIREISAAAESGDTLGGTVEVISSGLPPGLGSYAQWDRRLDGKLASAVMSIPAIKGVEIGMGFGAAALPGSKVHDEIFFDGEIRRRTNNAGGLEGGVTTGEALVVRAAMKPIATLRKSLDSVDISTMEPRKAHHERSDVCAVPACGVVAEAVVALELCSAFLEAFGGDTLSRVRGALDRYNSEIRQRFRHRGGTGDG